MPAEQRFWRLLTDYERLTQDEWAALSGKDFPAAGAIRSDKAALLTELENLSFQTGIDRNHPHFAARLKLLAEAEEEHRSALEAMLHEDRSRERKLDATRQRLRGLGSSYGPSHPAQPAFAAEG